MKKDEKTTSKWNVHENLHWIHLEGKCPEVALSDEELDLEHESRKQNSSGNTMLRGQAMVCPPGILPLRECFQGKGAKTNLGNVCINGGKEPKMSWILEVKFWQICRPGFLLCEWTRSWALLLEIRCPWAVWPPAILTVLRYSSAPNPWHCLKANPVTSCQCTGSKMMQLS